MAQKKFKTGIMKSVVELIKNSSLLSATDYFVPAIKATNATIKNILNSVGIIPDSDMDKDFINVSNTQYDKFMKTGDLADSGLLLEIIGAIFSVIALKNATTDALLEKSVRQPLMTKHRPSLLDVQSLLEMERRKIISTEERNTQLRKLGFSDDKINALAAHQWYIPSAQDIITFAVREVYTPSIAQKYGQYEGVDEVVAAAKNDLDAAGMSQETLSKYWAAHWQLPSPTQGFEMLQRGIISREELKTLLRAADYMPFWADKLIEMSYSPLTRVDVRRMYDMNVLTKEQVTKCYKDIGYNDSNAALLTEYTVKASKKEDSTNQQVKELSANTIIKAYKIGLFTYSEALKELTDIDYPSNVAEFLLMLEDYNTEYELTMKRVKLIENNYLRSIYTKQQAIFALGQINLPDRVKNIYIENWDLAKEIRPEKPTKSELLKWYKNNLITKEVLKSELAALGYAETYIELYIKSVGATTEEEK